MTESEMSVYWLINVRQTVWTQIRRVEVALHDKADDMCCICALSVNECYGKDFHKMHARLLKRLINSLPKRWNQISLLGQLK